MQLYMVQFDKNIVMHACMQGANLRVRKVPVAVMTARHQIPPSMSNHSDSLPIHYRAAIGPVRTHL